MNKSREIVTKENLKSALDLLIEVYKVIVAAGTTGQPSGPLYAQIMSKLSLESYQALIGQLIRTGLVRESNHVLYACPPTKDCPEG